MKQKKADIQACIMLAKSQSALDKYVEQLNFAEQLYQKMLYSAFHSEWDE